MLVGGSNIESRYMPFVTIILILANIGVFIKCYTLECQAHHEYQDKAMSIWIGEESRSSLKKEQEMIQFYEDWGFSMPDLTERGDFVSLFTHMFVHAGLGHIIGNMIMLWAFGLAMEEAMGSLLFGLFYIVCGLVAAFGQAACDMACDIPGVGASGAIAGVMGGFFVLFGTTAKVKLLIFIFYMPRLISVPAWLFGGFWIGSQLLAVAASGAAGGGVAWVAHLAGCVAGAGFVMLMRSELNTEVEKNSDGTISIKKNENVKLTEHQILEQVLDCQPVDVVVDHLLGDDAIVNCGDCGGQLDMTNPMGDRLVRCTGCGKAKYVDADLLMRGRDPEELNF